MGLAAHCLPTGKSAMLGRSAVRRPETKDTPAFKVEDWLRHVRFGPVERQIRGALRPTGLY